MNVLFRDLFLTADQDLLNFIAFIRVMVGAFALFHTAGENALGLIAFIAVVMGAFALRNPAGQDIVPGIAVIGMLVLGVFVRADQVTPFKGIAAVFNGMDMAGALFKGADENRLVNIAGIGMNVAVILFQSADQNLFFPAAFIGVDMNVALGQRADQDAVFIAVIVMVVGNGLGAFPGIGAGKDALGIGLRVHRFMHHSEYQDCQNSRAKDQKPQPFCIVRMFPDHSFHSRFFHE